ncbi:MAG: hypothetical protein ACYC1Q_07695 [Bacteroidia bacterium]
MTINLINEKKLMKKLSFVPDEFATREGVEDLLKSPHVADILKGFHVKAKAYFKGKIFQQLFDRLPIGGKMGEVTFRPMEDGSYWETVCYDGIGVGKIYLDIKSTSISNRAPEDPELEFVFEPYKNEEELNQAALL